MARIVWSGIQPPNRRRHGSVFYTSPFAPLDRQGAVPIFSGSFQRAQSSSLVSLNAYIWTYFFSDAQKALWAAAAVSPMTGYQLFLKYVIPPQTYGFLGPAVPYTPADQLADAIVGAFVDPIRSKIYISWFGDLPDPYPTPLYVGLAIEKSSLVTHRVSLNTPAVSRDLPAPKGYIAFGTIGPILPSTETIVDVTDAMLAFWGSYPTIFSVNTSTGWSTGSELSVQGYYFDQYGIMMSIAGALPFTTASPFQDYNLRSLTARATAPGAFYPSNTTAHVMRKNGLVVPDASPFRG